MTPAPNSGAAPDGAPRPVRMRHAARRLIVAMILLAALAQSFRFRLERLDRLDTSRFHSVYVPSGEYAKVACLGFRSVLSDFLYIWTIQYYSNDDRQERFKYLSQFYELITDLDPRFVNSYIIGALILGVEAGEPSESVRLLEKGMKANPGNWVLPFEAGYYLYKDLHDYEGAVRFFKIASEKKGAPEFTRRWYGHLLGKSGSLSQAMVFWQQVYSETGDEKEKRIALRHFNEAKVELDLRIIRGWLSRFQQANGRCPRSFDDLFASGVTDNVPVPMAPSGRPYSLNLRDCTVQHETTYLENK